jgi:hypothetical protein
VSKGRGAVQRRILAELAENTADPRADYDTPPCYQSWTRMADLARAADLGSKRRALRGLVAAGLVETMLLRPVSQRTLFRDGWAVRDGEGNVVRYPARDRGNRQLHARLVAR